MESSRIFPESKEYVPHAHKLEAPQHFIKSLREASEKIGTSQKENLNTNLIDFKQNILDFMKYFNLDMRDFESDMEDKRFIKGGFKKKAVIEHPSLGTNGLRLVRDKLSNGIFLKDNEDDLFKKLLERKLIEETVELTQAVSRKERKEELGDVFEVFDTYLLAKGIDKNLLEEERRINEFKIAKARRKLAKKK